MTGQDRPFVARLKKSSRYAHQTSPGEWFEIEFRHRYDDFCIVGNGNVYRLRDVVIGVRLPNGTTRPMQ